MLWVLMCSCGSKACCVFVADKCFLVDLSSQVINVFLPVTVSLCGPAAWARFTMSLGFAFPLNNYLPLVPNKRIMHALALVASTLTVALIKAAVLPCYQSHRSAGLNCHLLIGPCLLIQRKTFPGGAPGAAEHHGQLNPSPVVSFPAMFPQLRSCFFLPHRVAVIHRQHIDVRPKTSDSRKSMEQRSHC